jgi:hypothetical protein
MFNEECLGCQVDEIVIVAPLSNKVRSAIDTNYVHGKITLKPVLILMLQQ